MNRATRLLIASGLLAAAMPATAQDVVVMRRTVAPSLIGTDRSTAEIDRKGTWVEGPWRWATSQACSVSESRVRDVECQAGGKAVDASRCAGAKPATTEMAPRYEGCTTDWVTGEWSAYSSTCSASATRTRSVSCERFGGTLTSQPRPEAECSGTRPAGQEGPTSVTTGCVSYRWDVVEGACTAVLRRGRTITCQKVQGPTSTTVPDSQCNPAERPADYTLDDSCAPKSASCDVKTDLMISEFTTTYKVADRFDIPTAGKTTEQLRVEVAKFCDGHSYATSCQGIIAKSYPDKVQLFASDGIGNYKTQEQIYGSRPFQTVFGGACTPVF